MTGVQTCALPISWAGDHRPTVTAIGVAALAYPEVFLEIEGTALVP